MPFRFLKANLFLPLLDFLLPPLCLACDGRVMSDQALCPDCWKKISFIDKPFCARCGTPFEIPVEEGTLCGACIEMQPFFTKARAAMLYNDASKPLILRFKHADRTHPAKGLAGWMYRAGSEFLAEADLIVPIPLHRLRFFKRRYNQAALLAQQISVLAQKPFLPDGLLRTRATPPQGHLNKDQRKKNVRGSFKINPKFATKIKGKKIILIDDVFTTGATVNECSRVLIKNGAEEVFVLTLAKTKIST